MTLTVFRPRRPLALLAALVLISARPLSAQPQSSPPGHLKTDALVSLLSDDLMTLLVYNKVPDKVHRRAARDLYALLFQLWLVDGKHVDSSLDKQDVRLVLHYAGPDVATDDPLTLLAHYKGDDLDDVGRALAGLQPLDNAAVIFQKKAAYVRLVNEFSRWTLNPN